jgi:hypothetical protein
LLVSASGHFGVDRLDALADAELGVAANKVQEGLKVMARRAKVLCPGYPFVVNEVAVLRREGWPRLPYTSLLFLTPGSVARQTVRSAETAHMGELLEEIAEAALANFWGPGSAAIRFGHPSKHGRPKEFDQAVAWLALRMGLEPGVGYRPPRRKDGGVDVVAWRQFADKRPGFPIALAQCTIQAETFTKTTDIDLRLWASWLAMDVDPASMLVLPGTIRTAGPEWKQLATVVMVIDRIRLMDLLTRGDAPQVDLSWTEQTLAELCEVMERAAEL